MCISSKIKKTVLETIKEHDMLHYGDTVVVGVSGGADSVMLLHVLNSLKEEFGLNLKVAHVNHKIRHGDAERDAAFVESLCNQMNIPFYLKEINILEKAKEWGMSEEEAGHHARYAFFKELSEEKGVVAKIATAHNANDNVETVLMNLMRGTTLQGLQGIAFKNDNIIRPILGIIRSDIEEYLKENNLTHITDKTNFEDVYTRNKIRLNLIPYIEENFNGNFVKVLSQNIQGYREDNDFIKQSTDSYYELCCEEKEGKVLISLDDFLKMPIAMQKHVLFKAIKVVIGKTDRVDISNDIVNAICSKANSDSYMGKIFKVNGSCVVRFNYQGMIVEKPCEEKECSFEEFSFILKKEGEYKTPFGFSVKVSTVSENEITNTGEVLYLPMSYLGSECVLRTRRNGDVLRIDENCSKSLNRFFTDKKVNQEDRDLKYCLKIGEKIYWVKDLFGTRFECRNGTFLKLYFEGA